MKKYLLYAYILTLTTMLFGCSAQDSDGFFYNTFTKNMDVFLAYINKYIIYEYGTCKTRVGYCSRKDKTA